MRCKNCHYSLENLSEHRCPECGRAFDPNDPETWLSEFAPEPDTPARRAAVVGLAVVGFMLLAIWCLFLLWAILPDRF